MPGLPYNGIYHIQACNLILRLTLERFKKIYIYMRAVSRKSELDVCLFEFEEKILSKD